MGKKIHQKHIKIDPKTRLKRSRKHSQKIGGGDIFGRSPLKSTATSGFAPCSIRPLFAVNAPIKI